MNSETLTIIIIFIIGGCVAVILSHDPIIDTLKQNDENKKSTKAYIDSKDCIALKFIIDSDNNDPHWFKTLDRDIVNNAKDRYEVLNCK